AVVDAGAGALCMVPGVGRAHDGGPEGPRAALRRAVLIDAADGLAANLVAVEEDAVEAEGGGCFLQRTPEDGFLCIVADEGIHGEAEVGGHGLTLFGRVEDVALRAGAAVAAHGALEPEAGARAGGIGRIEPVAGAGFVTHDR